MISVLSNSYGQSETKAIHETMCAARAEFLKKYCGDWTCDVCPYRHVCYDLDKATDYTNKLQRGDRK